MPLAQKKMGADDADPFFTGRHHRLHLVVPMEYRKVGALKAPDNLARGAALGVQVGKDLP